MARNVRISELHENIGEHLRRIRGGEIITLLDDDTPIARIVPIENDEELLARPAVVPGGLVGYEPNPLSLRLGVDPVDVLLELRGDR